MSEKIPELFFLKSECDKVLYRKDEETAERNHPLLSCLSTEFSHKLWSLHRNHREINLSRGFPHISFQGDAPKFSTLIIFKVLENVKN